MNDSTETSNPNSLNQVVPDVISANLKDFDVYVRNQQNNFGSWFTWESFDPGFTPLYDEHHRPYVHPSTPRFNNCTLLTDDLAHHGLKKGDSVRHIEIIVLLVVQVLRSATVHVGEIYTNEVFPLQANSPHPNVGGIFSFQQQNIVGFKTFLDGYCRPFFGLQIDNCEMLVHHKMKEYITEQDIMLHVGDKVKIIVQGMFVEVITNNNTKIPWHLGLYLG
jgi:hypothetical protein